MQYLYFIMDNVTYTFNKCIKINNNLAVNANYELTSFVNGGVTYIGIINIHDTNAPDQIKGKNMDIGYEYDIVNKYHVTSIESWKLLYDINACSPNVIISKILSFYMGDINSKLWTYQNDTKSTSVAWCIEIVEHFINNMENTNENVYDILHLLLLHGYETRAFELYNTSNIVLTTTQRNDLIILMNNRIIKFKNDIHNSEYLSDELYDILTMNTRTKEKFDIYNKGKLLQSCKIKLHDKKIKNSLNNEQLTRINQLIYTPSNIDNPISTLIAKAAMKLPINKLANDDDIDLMNEILNNHIYKIVILSEKISIFNCT